MDPWNSPFEVKGRYKHPFPPAVQETRVTIQKTIKGEGGNQLVVPENEFVKVYDDHITINNEISILRVPYFTERLKDLDGFEGWSPRWYLPAKELTFSKSNNTAVVTMMVIDSKNEIKIDFGYDW